ncbi:MAG: hypothetical protein ACR2MY_01785 [Candidatus Dormibacteria bacterium]
MSWARRATALALVGLPVALAGCGGGGGGAAANGGDPVAVAQGYIDAVKTTPSGGLQFLESESTEKLTGPTSLSRYLAANKGATAEILTLPWIPPGGTTGAPSKKQCLVVPPQGGQICIVTVEVKAGGKSRYFHLNLETRYVPGVFQIIDVDEVSKPDELLPTGNEAHQTS